MVPPAAAPSDAGKAFNHASHIHDACRAFCVTSIKILCCLQWNCVGRRRKASLCGWPRRSHLPAGLCFGLHRPEQ
ncbi:hypothetical protein Naga_100001g145 [Nannochloropsis gaditana]|uniref:Uncharacterized protein n=1 Tax=Nannochloropsis gaditana TaxID=72520 RepID=W7TSR8_9STRA|nr:hypothetical protein Naga_100001g145 [Nannochloropsis gaditana]